MLQWWPVSLFGFIGLLVGCRVHLPDSTYRCALSTECPEGFRCEQARGVCTRGDPALQPSTPTTARDVDAGVGTDAMSTEPPVGGAGGEQAPQKPSMMPPRAGMAAADGGSLSTPPSMAGEGGARAASDGGHSGGSDAAQPATAGRDAAGQGGSGPDAQQAAVCNTDLNTDPNNCGACGRSCLGLSCASGLCLPMRLAWTADEVRELALGDDAVYFSELTSIKKVGYAGGEVTKLATELNVDEIALDASYVYCGQILGRIFKLPRNGGAAITLTSNGYTQHLTTDGQHVYYLGGSTTYNYIMRVPVMGGNAERLTTTETGGKLAIDATSIYWTTHNENAIYKVAVAGGTPTKLAMDLTYPAALAVDAKHIYWCDTTDLRLMQMQLDGSQPRVVAENVHCSDIASDGDAVYWVDNVDEGVVAKQAASGGPTVVLARTQTPRALAVDQRWVYWVKLGPSGRPGGEGTDNQDRGELLKVPK